MEKIGQRKIERLLAIRQAGHARRSQRHAMIGDMSARGSFSCSGLLSVSNKRESPLRAVSFASEPEFEKIVRLTRVGAFSARNFATRIGLGVELKNEGEYGIRSICSLTASAQSPSSFSRRLRTTIPRAHRGFGVLTHHGNNSPLPRAQCVCRFHALRYGE